MGEKKHIDRLFQESFKDFEAIPSDAVWKNIEANLNKNKKRRVIPIWWKYAGVAALLLLLLTVGNLFFNPSENTPQNQIVDIETNSEEKSDATSSNPLNTVDQSKKGVANNNLLKEDSNNISETELLLKPTLNEKINKSSIAKNQTDTNKNEAALISNTKKLTTNKNKHQVLAEVNKDNEILPKENINNEVTVASNIEKPSNSNDDTLIDKAIAKEIINKSSKNNVASTTDEEKNTLTIEEAIEENKNKIEKEDKTNKWSVAPNAAPVYFNTLGKGSSIGQQFNNNSKTGDVNMSYGISTSYALNKKLKIRSGINKVNLGYNTNDVIVFQSSGSSSSALKNVDSDANLEDNVAIVSGSALTPESFSSTNTSLNQSLGYIEIPLELQYSLSENRLGVNVIGGFSSFFLNDNSVYSETENGQRIFLGEANNINKTSYSANFGIGLNYKFSKKIDLNLEPTFKYQFNTFNNTTGNFTPFFIGVYTGFAIKF